MNTNVNYKVRPVRSPLQPHPVQVAREKAMDTQSEEHPIRQEVRKLCGTYALSAVFSEDSATLAALKTPGLIAVKCVLSLSNGNVSKPIGVGHGSSVLSRINKGIERSIFGCLNGALMSAINSGCKSLDAMRLEETKERRVENSFAKSAKNTYDEEITDKQKSLLTELLYSRVQNESERESRLSEIQSMSKSDAGEMISNLLAASRR